MNGLLRQLEKSSKESAYPQPLATQRKLHVSSREPTGEINIVQAVLAKNYRYRVEYLTPTEKDYELAAKLETSPEAAAQNSPTDRTNRQPQIYSGFREQPHHRRTAWTPIRPA